MSDDDDTLGEPLGERLGGAGLGELAELMEELRTLLKTSEVVAALTDRGVNASLALVAMDGIDAYLRGDKLDAAEDLRTVAEEIEGRLAMDRDAPSA
jgi:hypothetical protein